MAQNELWHYGMPRRSGRYPWGSGERPFQGEAKIKGNYTLKKYSSPSSMKAKSIAKQTLNQLLAMTIPGYATVMNAKTIYSISKNNFDKSDYVKSDGDYEKLSSLRKKTSIMTPKQDTNLCNPRIGNQRGKINNCVLCSAAYEMRRRGYDVQARRSGRGFQVDKVYNEWFKKPNIIRPDIVRKPNESRKQYVNRAYDDICNRMERYGDGARGTMVVVWDKTTSGHAFSWEVTNGKVYFYDGQNKKMNPENQAFSLADPSKHAFVRLDNLEINPSITEAVISRKGK